MRCRAARCHGLRALTTLLAPRPARRQQLRGFEVVRKIKLVAEVSSRPARERAWGCIHTIARACGGAQDFSVENGLLTPTFKLKRHQARVAFQVGPCGAAEVLG